MENLTELEKDVLAAIINSEYQSGLGEQVVNHAIWSDCISYDCKIAKGKVISGVVSSLVKKGFVQTDGKIQNGTIWITQAGYKILN